MSASFAAAACENLKRYQYGEFDASLVFLTIFFPPGAVGVVLFDMFEVEVTSSICSFCLGAFFYL
jgi:hypothetical protein